MMEPLVGTSFEAFPWRNLEKVSDLISFDGPLLSLFKNRDGDRYLYYWCDADSEVNRWLVLRISREDLEAYLHRRISLQRIISAPTDGLLFALDIDHSLNVKHTLLLSPDNLPYSYVPGDDSLLESPPRLSDVGSKSYMISIDGDWALEDLSAIPHNYGKAYALMYSLAQHAGAWAYHAFPWFGGYSTVNFYRTLQAVIPEIDQPKLLSFQYASPGWLELSLSIPIALQVKDSIGTYIEHDDAWETYSEVMKELKARHLLGRQYPSSPDADTDLVQNTGIPLADDLAVISDATSGLSTILNIESATAKYLDSLTEDPLISLKILLSYFRIIRKLAPYQIDGRAKY